VAGIAAIAAIAMLLFLYRRRRANDLKAGSSANTTKAGFGGGGGSSAKSLHQPFLVNNVPNSVAPSPNLLDGTSAPAAAAAARGIASSNVAKYHVGQFVQQLGASGLTGTVIRIEASAPGQSLVGPGTVFVQPQPGSGGTSASSTMARTTAAAAAHPTAPLTAAQQVPPPRAPPPPSTAQSFTSAQLAACTSNFSTELGKGAFGAVFGGVLPDGRRVAVKQMSLAATALKKGAETTVTLSTGANKFTGEAGFRRELEMLGRCAHANIVPLLGYCIEKRKVGRSMFSLVIEFMPGGSLLDALKPGSRRPPLAAAQRLDVASDVARGLHYLHTEVLLVHQDIKSDNVLLAVDGASGRVVAKVADFGTARVVPKQAMQAHHSTRVVIGTTPYMPMEYMQSGHVSEKTDTYAFGVVLCELLSSKPPFNSDTCQMLAAEMQQLLQLPVAAMLPQLLDARAGAWPRGAAVELARIARLCVNAFAHERCTLRDIVHPVDVLAGRAPTPPHRTTVALRPTGMAAPPPNEANINKPAGACPHCGTKLRFRAGTALPCFTCKR
jgi:hypothetical protein